MDHGQSFKYHIDYEHVESMWAANNSAKGYSDNALIAEQKWKIQTGEVSYHLQKMTRMADDLTHHVEFMHRNSRNAKESDDLLAVHRDNVKALEKIMGPLFQDLFLTDAGQVAMVINMDSFTHVLRILHNVCKSTSSGFEFAEGMLNCAERMCKTLEAIRLQHENPEIEADIFNAYENDEEVLCKVSIAELLRDPSYDHVALSQELANLVIDGSDRVSVVDLLQQAMIVIVQAGNCLQDNIRPMIDIADVLVVRKTKIDTAREDARLKQLAKLSTKAPSGENVVRLRTIPDSMKLDK